MFYLETKDGERFLTNSDSNDNLEFERILENKLGKSAAELFDTLICDARDESQELINAISHSYKDCINRLDAALNKQPVDLIELEEILSDLQTLYTEYIL